MLAQALQAEGNADARHFRVVQFLIWQPWQLVLPELAAQCGQMQRKLRLQAARFAKVQ